LRLLSIGRIAACSPGCLNGEGHTITRNNQSNSKQCISSAGDASLAQNTQFMDFAE
jgi:hypothetical protein